MLAWKLLVPVAAALIGTGITATTVVQKAGFSCIVPWYTDTSCGIPKLSIPPKGQLQINVDAVTKDGKKYDGVCPTVTFYDAKNDKERNSCSNTCDRGLCTTQNPSNETDKLVYVRFSTGYGELYSVDVRGSWWVVQ